MEKFPKELFYDDTSSPNAMLPPVFLRATPERPLFSKTPSPAAVGQASSSALYPDDSTLVRRSWVYDAYGSDSYPSGQFGFD